MAISPSPPPPPPSPSPGDPIEAARHAAAAALAVPARLWGSLLARLPSLSDRCLRRRRRPALPLPFRTAAAHSARATGETPKAFGILEDIVQHTLSSLHGIQKSLLFWQSKAEGTNSQKMYFMIFERGPRAFVKATYQTLTRLRSNESPTQYILHSASDMVSTKLAVLTNMQHCLAVFLAEIYCEVDKFKEGLTENSDKSLHTLFAVLNTVFSKLEVSLQNVCEGHTLLFALDGSPSEFLFERLPEIDYENSEWTEASSTDAICLIYQNLQKLDNLVCSQLSRHKKPRHMTIYWLPYTCGALGLSACSLWLLRHSSLMGSSDIDNWVQSAKESIAGFWDVHVEKPIISIRGELFETFKNRGKHVMDTQEVQLNEEVLRRMMLAFCQQTANEKLPQDISDQALMENFMERYEKEWTHPVKNLFGGEAMLELDQILKGNAINFAILAALPAFGVSLLLLTVVQAWVMNDQGAEGRGRIARRQRRLLLLDAERKLMEFKNCMINGMEEEACCKFGLTLYNLDRLYRAVESHAEETGEWSRLREDILDLAKPTMSMTDKLVVLSRLKGTMAASPPPRSPSSGDPAEAADLAAALAAPARVWSSLLARLPSLSDYSRVLSVGRGRGRRRRRAALPLPIRPAASHSARIAGQMPKAFDILQDVVQHTLSNLHDIQKSLIFWQSKAEGTNSQKLYFVIFERGPRAFVEAAWQTLTRLKSNASPVPHLLHSASDMVSTKLAVLTSMQHCLSAFLAEVYFEVDKCRKGLTESSDKSLHTLFIVLNSVFSKLEVSFRNAVEGQTLLCTHDGKSPELIFERLPEVDVESSEWTEVLSASAITLIYQNLQKFDDFISDQFSSHKRPRNMTIYWLPYTCGALGLSACSLWLLRHSSLMGSSDIDNWIQDAKESMVGFWDVHVGQPIISIRDELFETFKQRSKREMEKQEVQQTEESLRRMLLDFCGNTSNEKPPQDMSELAMMEIVMKRYEKEAMHPFKGLSSGKLTRALSIQIEKHKLALLEAMLELDQILRANEINFAILAALPAFGVSLLLLFAVRAWATHGRGAEGRGRTARRQRRLLLADVEKRLMEFQNCMANGMEEEACCKFGLTLYTLDRLYKAVESHARETGEWSSLREDMFDLAKPGVGMEDKLVLLSRLKGMYDCLLPSPSGVIN
uniref:Uncharacterized protein n=1 Tax=Oryza meridionalis TaxID=40149 RepID=A0A0E0D1C2_9ORYZ